MTEMLEQFARERALAVQHTAEHLSTDLEELLVLLRQNHSFVRFLSDLWHLTMSRLKLGGMPAKLLARDCHLILELAPIAEAFLRALEQLPSSGSDPSGKAEAAIRAESQATRSQLDELVQGVHTTLAWASQQPRVSAPPLDVERRVQETEERDAWEPLGKVIARLRNRESVREG